MTGTLMDKSNSRFLISSFAGAFLAGLFWLTAFKFPEGPLGIRTLGNIPSYLIFAVLWIGTFFILFFLLEKKQKKISRILSIALVSLEGLTFLILCKRLFDILGKGGSIKYIVAAFLFTFGLTFYTAKFRFNFFRHIKTIILWSETAAFAGLWFFACLTMNTFSHFSFGRSYNIYHSSAYIDSIYNTYYGAPFTGIEAELYGHYGLIFQPFLRILGANTRTIALVLGLLGAGTVTLLCACIIMTVKPFVLKLFGIAAVGIYGITAYSIYWQTFPHRMFFPALIIFLITLAAKRNSFTKTFFFLGLIITSLALIWNTESGAVVMIVWSIYGAEAFRKEGSKNKLVPLLISLPVSIVSTLLITLGTLNIYNLATGGDLIGPKGLVGFQGQGFVGSISKELPGGNALYLHIFIALFICAVWSVGHIYVKGDCYDKAMFALATSVTGLGMSIYFVNNPEGGSAVLNMYFMACAVIILSGAKFSFRLYDIAKLFLALYASMMLFFGGACGRPLVSQVKSHKAAGAYEYSKFRSFTEDLEARIAPDTKGSGCGTSAVFFELGRDKGGRDFHFDLNELDSPEHFIKFCDGNDEIEGYEIIDVIHYEEVAFNYYEKIS